MSNPLSMIKLFFVFFCLMPQAVHAWNPQGQIAVTIGYAAGSMNEIVFRKAAEIVVKNNPGITFVITARPGADGVISNNFLVSQPANGYHIGVPSSIATVLLNDVWQKDIKKYQWENLIFPVLLGEVSMTIVASKQSPVNTFEDFVNLIKQPNRNINIATPGGSGSLIFKYIMSNANGDSDLVKEIKYSNTPQTALSVASNTTEFGITALPGVIELAKAQRLKILALTGNAALGMTSTKSIMPDFYLNNGYMIALPPDTPMHIVQWYEKEFTKAIRHPDYQHWAKENHIHVDPNLVSNARVKSYFYSMKNRFKPIMQLLDQI